MQSLRRIAARVRAWVQQRRRLARMPSPIMLFTIPPYTPPIHREVTSSGVHVFSLCGDCGARLQASATLCDECAQKRSRPARPF